MTSCSRALWDWAKAWSRLGKLKVNWPFKLGLRGSKAARPDMSVSMILFEPNAEDAIAGKLAHRAQTEGCGEGYRSNELWHLQRHRETLAVSLSGMRVTRVNLRRSELKRKHLED